MARDGDMGHLKQLIRELRRRHVLRVAAAYVVGAWVLLQVADLAFESLELPGRALGYVWLALFVGFPAALVFGWRYDFTADGIVRTRQPRRPCPTTRRSRRRSLSTLRKPWGLAPEQLAAIPFEVTLPPGYGTTGP